MSWMESPSKLLASASVNGAAEVTDVQPMKIRRMKAAKFIAVKFVCAVQLLVVEEELILGRDSRERCLG